jgi:diguanylate cyclase (GGDEF)-like protein
MTHELLNGVAATTVHRDRDDLDRAVALLLLRFLETRSVTVLRLADEGTAKRVARCVRVAQQPGGTGVDSPENTAELPALIDFPAWQKCAATNQIVRSTSTNESLTTVFPIQGTSEVVGLLVVETTTALSARESDLVFGILGIVKNHLALLDYGELDTLTGLLNRKTFENHFHKLCRKLTPPEGATPKRTERRTADAREPSWLALIDVDYFKSINDGYGHLFGDEVLLLVSRLMRRSLRGADHLFRFGGEEFVVVLDRASQPGVEIVCERLRAAVEQHRFPQVGGVTISVGYTRINPRDISTTCIERADAALYYAKSHGRNNVRSWEALQAAGEVITRAGAGGDIELF